MSGNASAAAFDKGTRDTAAPHDDAVRSHGRPGNDMPGTKHHGNCSTGKATVQTQQQRQHQSNDQQQQQQHGVHAAQAVLPLDDSASTNASSSSRQTDRKNSLPLPPPRTAAADAVTNADATDDDAAKSSNSTALSSKIPGSHHPKAQNPLPGRPTLGGMHTTTWENASPLSSPWNSSVYRYSHRHRRQTRRRRNAGNSQSSSMPSSVGTSAQPWHDHMRRVGRQAAYHTKSLVWDSNEPTLNAADNLVDHWENAYRGARSGVVWGLQQTVGVYSAAKDGASSVMGAWRPFCDWILLPTWNGAEWLVWHTAAFLQSPTAHQWAQHVVAQVRQVPLVGPHLLAPALVGTAQLGQRTWHILQYPIPSKHAVRQTVDASLNATKWGLATAAGHVVWFVKRADAIISRTLSQTQWNVLGSGPYLELAAPLRTSLLHSLADRYLDMLATSTIATATGASPVTNSAVARYEWMARIRFQNERLAVDLAAFLVAKCAEKVADDEWLHPCPVYRHLQRSFLLPESADNGFDNVAVPGHGNDTRSSLTWSRSALWFYQPAVNGQAPSRDTPWIIFAASEQAQLEKRYLELVQGRAPLAYGTFTSNLEASEEDFRHLRRDTPTRTEPTEPASTSDSHQSIVTAEESPLDETILVSNETVEATEPFPGSTMAHWYTPNAVTDIKVDQQRHCVTMMAACPRCEASLEIHSGPPRVPTPPGLCRSCRRETIQSPWTPAPAPMAWPAYTSRRRPALWRFYGSGDIVRRSVWFLEHKSVGLQPFDTAASRILEDAYWFLRWRALQQNAREEAASVERSISVEKHENDEERNDGLSYDVALLTVEVVCPDGTARLVQFSSLFEATAIHKGLGAAFTLHKRRVYRGAWLKNVINNDSRHSHPCAAHPTLVAGCSPGSPVASRSLSTAAAFLPTVPLRDVLTPTAPLASPSGWDPLPYVSGPERHDLSVPPARFHQEDMERFWMSDSEEGSSTVDHLCLIVHGIGEMLRSIDVFGLSLPNLASIVDCCAFLRRNHAAVQRAQFQQLYPTMQPGATGSPGRVEYLPVGKLSRDIKLRNILGVDLA
jgi:hypothetical protein